MCLIPPYSTLWWMTEMRVSPLITIVELFIWLFCPLLLAQSALPKGPFGQASTSPAPGHCGAGSPSVTSLFGATCAILSVLSHPLLSWPVPMACCSSGGNMAFCLWAQQVSSVFFSVFIFLQPSCWEQTFLLLCQEQRNLQHFLLAC